MFREKARHRTKKTDRHQSRMSRSSLPYRCEPNCHICRPFSPQPCPSSPSFHCRDLILPRVPRRDFYGIYPGSDSNHGVTFSGSNIRPRVKKVRNLDDWRCNAVESDQYGLQDINHYVRLPEWSPQPRTSRFSTAIYKHSPGPLASSLRSPLPLSQKSYTYPESFLHPCLRSVTGFRSQPPRPHPPCRNRSQH
jgi:hypothetical protein